MDKGNGFFVRIVPQIRWMSIDQSRMQQQHLSGRFRSLIDKTLVFCSLNVKVVIGILCITFQIQRLTSATVVALVID